MFSARNTGSCNDCTAWDRSKLKKGIDEGRLPNKYFFIGDEGFTCEDQFVTPWSGTGIGIAKDAFNYHLSVRRQVIERAFGILTKRWGIFWRPLNCGFHNWSLIAMTCAKLHNICVDANDTTILPQHRDNFQEGARFTNILHPDDDNHLPQRAHGRTGGARRLSMTQHLELADIRLPTYAGKNSRQ
jgi:hypothetical protein